MDTDDPGGLTRSTGGGSAPRTRLPRLVDRGGSIFVITAVLGALLLVARPVAAIGPLPDPALPAALPSLPVPLPSLPLPTLPPLPVPTLPPLPLPTVRSPTPPPLPLPTLPPVPSLPVPTLPPVPSLPVPTPTLPVPTPTVSIAPSLPIGASASPSPSPSTAVASASPGPSPSPSPAPGAGTLIGASGAPVDATTVSTAVDPPIAGSSDSFLESLVVPGLLIGVPAIIIIGILIAQLAVGAAWLPVIRRWLNRRV